MPNKKSFAFATVCFLFSAAGATAFAGDALNQLLGSPDFDSSGANKGPVTAPDFSGSSALTPTRAADTAPAEATTEIKASSDKSIAATVPNPARQDAQKAAEAAAPAPPPPSPEPIDPLNPVKAVLGALKTPITLGAVGGYIGWAIAGTVAGAMTGGLLFILFFLLASL